MNPLEILAQYYDLRSETFNILVEHGEQVARKAPAAARPTEKSITEIIHNLNRYGPDKVQRFESWVKMFE